MKNINRMELLFSLFTNEWPIDSAMFSIWLCYVVWARGVITINAVKNKIDYGF